MENKVLNTAIELLAKNEETVSQLYSTYADKFSNWNKFWISLSIAEVEHANWIRSLHSKYRDKKVFFKENRFKIEPIKIFTDYLEKQITQARGQEIPIKGALTTALDIENALIENRYFEVLEEDSAELKQTLLDLARATRDHKNAIQEILAKL